MAIQIEKISETKIWIHDGATSIAIIDTTGGVRFDGTISQGNKAVGAGLDAFVQGLAAGYKIARGQRTMLSAADTIATGLTTVIGVQVTMESDPILTFDRVTAQVGDQAGSPVAGSIIVKGWMPTGAALTTPIAATGYSGIKVNWLAYGT